MSHGPVMLDLGGLEMTADEREILRHPATGGVILFARNFESVEQLYRLVSEIHELRKPGLLVAVDQEGGRVQRFRDGFTLLPAAQAYGQAYGRSSKQGMDTAREAGWLMAAELLSVGVDFSFAPVLDLDRGISEVIGDRAFSGDPEIVSRLAQAWCHGVHDAGMASVVKHFPGHGGVAADSHLALPVDERELDDIWADDLMPFRRLIESGVEGMMPAHVIYQRVDELPAGFSRHWLKEILRGQLGYTGAIFSDDLSMAAAHMAGSYSERAQLALQAGCDMVLVCNNPQGAAEVLDSLSDYSDPVALARLARLHGKNRLPMAKLHEHPRWRGALDLLAALEQENSLSLDL